MVSKLMCNWRQFYYGLEGFGLEKVHYCNSSQIITMKSEKRLIYFSNLIDFGYCHPQTDVNSVSGDFVMRIICIMHKFFIGSANFVKKKNRLVKL